MHFEDGDRGHKPKNMCDLQELEKEGSKFWPRASFKKKKKNAGLLTPDFRTSELQNHKREIFARFYNRLWFFVTEAQGKDCG